MSHLYLRGRVDGVFTQAAGKAKDGSREWEARTKVQVLCKIRLPNGDERTQVYDLVTREPERFRSLQGKEVEVAVGAFVQDGPKPSVSFFMPKGGEAEIRVL